MNARNISRKTIIRHLQIYNNASYQYTYGRIKNFFLQKIKFSAEHFSMRCRKYYAARCASAREGRGRGVRGTWRGNIVANITFERREIRV